MDGAKPESTNSPQDPQPGKPGSAHRGWWVFFLALIAPAVLTLLTAKSENLWPVFTFPASGIAGLYCGFYLSFRICKTTPGKILSGLALAFVFAASSFALCCVGCAVGGATLNIH